MKETEKLHKIAAVSAHEARREESPDRARDIHFSSENKAFRYSARLQRLAAAAAAAVGSCRSTCLLSAIKSRILQKCDFEGRIISE